MAEPADFFERRTLVPLAVVLLLVAAVVLIAFGPGRRAIVTARAEAEEKGRRIAEWELESGVASDVGAVERVVWQEQYDRFEAMAVSGRDEASLMAHVANVVSAPSLTGLELTSLAEDEPEGGASLRAREPFGPREFELSRLPMRVRFDVDYVDLFPILSRLQSRSHGLVLTRAAFERHFPGVRVDLEVDVWVRREVAS